MKIGFIAMSGVRVHSKELLDLGLNLPGFVERSKVIASLPSLGLLTLAGMTPPDIDVEYIEIADLDPAAPLRGGFDAVAISSFTAMIKDAYTLADRYRAAGVVVMLGGLHVALVPDEAALHADAIVVGEAEPVWPEVIRDLRSGRVKPRYQTQSGAFDLSLAPMPRFDLLDPSRYNRLTVLFRLILVIPQLLLVGGGGFELLNFSFRDDGVVNRIATDDHQQINASVIDVIDEVF